MIGRLVELVPELVRTAISHVRRDWWRTGIRLPRPSQAHLRWRMETAYGSSDATPDRADVIDFVAWRRRQRRARAGSG